MEDEVRKAYPDDKFPKPKKSSVKPDTVRKPDKGPTEVLLTDAPEERSPGWGAHQQDEQS